MGNLFAWFGTLQPQMKAVMVLIGIGLLVIVGATAFHVVDTLTETAEQKGAVTERAATTGKVIENVQKAKAAADDVRRDGPTVAECLQDSRVRENC